MQHGYQLQVSSRFDRHHVTHKPFVVFKAGVDGFLFGLPAFLLDLLGPLISGKGQLELLADGRRKRAAINSPQLGAFLDRIAKAAAPQFLVIGVKPGTYLEFNLVRAQAEAKGISLGYEPLDPQWSVKPPPASAGAVAP